MNAMTTTGPHVRWMIRRDMPEVLEIEHASFGFPWSEDDFMRCLRQRNYIGMVAEFGEKVAGFMVYEPHKTRLALLDFAVAPGFRRRGVGAALVRKLTGKLFAGRREKILLYVRDSNLAAQLFFRSVGFRATSVHHGFYDETDEDAYLFEYRIPNPEPVAAA